MSSSTDIRVLTEEEYPPLLREMTDPPEKLYGRGAPVLWDGRTLLTVVGSRDASAYGSEVAAALISGLSGYPIVIVSGLAIGIDTRAHRAALDAHLQTIAVPGSGLNEHVLYPRSNRRLAREILEANGLLLSELTPATEAAPWTFPRRNRIMAGMSHATLVIEASMKSGTLITARLAMEYNREVLTVPGSIFSAHSAGPHALIRDGATPITTPEDILEALHIPRHLTETTPLDATDEERALLALLDAPRSRDDLVRAAGRATHDINITLSLLELKGYVRDHNGTIMRLIRFES